MQLKKAALVERGRALDSWLSDAARSTALSGAVLFARGDVVLVSRAFGMANAEHGVANEARTKFRIASLTKAFTAAAVLLLRERGRLGVTDRLAEHLDDCPEAWSAVTLHHLLCHTSGIPNFVRLPRPPYARRMPATPADNLAPVRDLPLEFAPGTSFAYSNSGYVLLGLVIERVSGESYAAFVERHILRPLGMGDSGYDDHRTILPARAAGYEWRDGVLANADFHDMGNPFAAGGLYSTVEDLRRWDRALTGDALLGPESREALFAPHARVHDAPPLWHGYGWELGSGAHGGRSQRFFGGITGFSAYLARYPEEDALVVVLSNVEDRQHEVGEIGDGLTRIALRPT